jgi:hypothetical protein
MLYLILQLHLTAEARANEAADLADAEANLAAIVGTAASASGDGVYSNAALTSQ